MTCETCRYYSTAGGCPILGFCLHPWKRGNNAVTPVSGCDKWMKEQDADSSER